MFNLEDAKVALEPIKSKEGKEFNMARIAAGAVALLCFVNTTKDGARMFAGDVIKAEIDHKAYADTLQPAAIAADAMLRAGGDDLATSARGSKYAVHSDEWGEYRAFASGSNGANTNVYCVLSDRWGDAAGLTARITVIDSNRGGGRMAYVREADGKAILDASFIQPELVTDGSGQKVRALRGYQNMQAAKAVLANAKVIAAVNRQLS